MLWFHHKKIIKNLNEVKAKFVDTSAINLNKLIVGLSVNGPNASNVIAMQGHVKRLNGSGLKLS